MAVKKYSSRKYSDYIENSSLDYVSKLKKSQDIEKATALDHAAIAEATRARMERGAESDSLKQHDKRYETSMESQQWPIQRDLRDELMRSWDSQQEVEAAVEAALNKKEFRNIGNARTSQQYKKNIQEAASLLSRDRYNRITAAANKMGLNVGHEMTQGLPAEVDMASRKLGLDRAAIKKEYGRLVSEYAGKGFTTEGVNHSVLNEALSNLTKNQPVSGKMPVKIPLESYSYATASGATKNVKPHLHTYWTKMAQNIPEELQQQLATQYHICPEELEKFVTHSLNRPHLLQDKNFMNDAAKLMVSKGVGLIKHKYADQQNDASNLTDGQRGSLSGTLTKLLGKIKVGESGKSIGEHASDTVQGLAQGIMGKQPQKNIYGEE